MWLSHTTLNSKEKESEQIQQMYNMDEKQRALKLLVTDTYDSLNRIKAIEETPLKVVKGENGPTTFLPLNTKISGQARYIKDKEAVCLTEDQVKYIYKKVETENILNVDTIKHEIEEDKLENMDDTNGEMNPYHGIITNKVEKDDIIISPMEQWLILSNIINYIQYDRHPKLLGFRY